MNTKTIPKHTYLIFLFLFPLVIFYRLHLLESSHPSISETIMISEGAVILSLFIMSINYVISWIFYAKIKIMLCFLPFFYVFISFVSFLFAFNSNTLEGDVLWIGFHAALIIISSLCYTIGLLVYSKVLKSWLET